jgi:ABC-type nitrate/sulfonate/bicarbonate transport system ATPase subunit
MEVEMTDLLEVAIDGKTVRVMRRPRQILGPVRFGVPQGEFVSIVGPSGCGKTTLLRCIAGLDREFSGQISVGGERVRGPGLDRGVVFQEPRLMPWMSVRDNVLFAAPKRTDEASRRVDELLALVGLRGFEEHWPKQLSGGMAQRGGLARALFNVPRLLLLDEPFGALDNFTRARMQQELLRIVASEHLTALFVTHDIDEAVMLSDRIFVMGLNPGTILEEVAVPLAHQRDRNDHEFVALRAQVERLLPEGQTAVSA